MQGCVIEVLWWKNYFSNGFLPQMILCNKIENTLGLSQKLMEHLDLNNMDKGSGKKDWKVKSLEQQWFSERKNSKKKSVTDEKGDSDIYIEMYSLIQMSCKQRRHEFVDYYRFLSLFEKYYRNGTFLMRTKWSGAISANKKMFTY